MILRVRKWGSDEWTQLSLGPDPEDALYLEMAEGIQAFALASWAEKYHVQAWNPESLGWDEMGEGE